jgi:hypothetical protein
MRSIEEFKQDREQWNRETARKLGIRRAIGWVIALVVIVIAAIAGLKAYQTYQANNTGEKPKDQAIQVPGSGS